VGVTAVQHNRRVESCIAVTQPRIAYGDPTLPLQGRVDGGRAHLAMTEAAVRIIGRVMSPHRPLRRGWTTGTCATAAAKAAYAALLTGEFPDPVEVTLPRGERVSFALATSRRDTGSATAGVIKDAGDDPDVTHGALVLATVRHGAPGGGVAFRAGAGVGTVTRAGLPVPPGEPAINPVPRRMIREAIAEVAAAAHGTGDVEVEIGIADGERLAARTLNARLGIIGGLSILGTTGIVVPYSCSAWIHSIHSGIDVARAAGLDHIAGATGATSESAVQKRHGLPEIALIDMGDFVGGMLKYLRRHPVPRVTIAGGVGKMTKLAQGLLDLHSRRGAVDLAALARFAQAAGGSDELCTRIAHANTAAEAFAHAAAEGVSLGDEVARAAHETARHVVEESGIALEVVLFDRDGQLVGQARFPNHERPLNLRR
jgi:cobalt-precorrin-5B (C1)-methyltransferase